MSTLPILESVARFGSDPTCALIATVAGICIMMRSNHVTFEFVRSQPHGMPRHAISWSTSHESRNSGESDRNTIVPSSSVVAARPLPRTCHDHESRAFVGSSDRTSSSFTVPFVTV